MLDGIGLEGLLIGREGAAAVSQTACVAGAPAPLSASDAARGTERSDWSAFCLPGVYREAERRLTKQPSGRSEFRAKICHTRLSNFRVADERLPRSVIRR